MKSLPQIPLSGYSHFFNSAPLVTYAFLDYK